MINLIPNTEKKKMIKDFYLRVLVVVISALSGCFLIIFIALLPSYFLSSVKKNLANERLNAQKNELVGTVDQEALVEVQDLNAKLGLIEQAEKNKFAVSQVMISETVLKKMPDIKITEFFYENDPASGEKITIRGRAPSRDRLLFFRRALEGDLTFKKVDLPISNFLKGSNIAFYVSLTL